MTNGATVAPNRRVRQDMPMRVSAKTDYALRAAAELAAADHGGLVKAERISHAQGIPLKFLLNILNELKQDGLVRSQRGSDGGYRLARPARPDGEPRRCAGSCPGPARARTVGAPPPARVCWDRREPPVEGRRSFSRGTTLAPGPASAMP